MEAALGRIDAAIGRWTMAGLGRLDAGAGAEIEALRQMAHHGGLVRIERELKALGAVIDRWVQRDPAFRPDAFLGGLMRVHGLMAAARRVNGADDATRRAVLGEARRVYEPVGGPLVVAALGASAWRTDSGFVGVTVALATDDTVLQVSATRPEMAMPTPQGLWRMPLSESSGLSASDLASGAFQLTGARVSSDRRLSMAAGLIVRRAAGPPDPWAPFRAERWQTLAQRWQDAPLDLVPVAESQWALLVAPEVGNSVVDEVRNEVRVALRDPVGAEAHVAIPLRADTAILRANLLALAGRRPDGIFGRVDVSARGLRFDPWTALFDAPVRTRAGPVNALHLGLDALVSGSRS